MLKKAQELIKEYGTTDPFLIAESMGINIIFSDLKEVSGFYQSIGDFKFIHINNRLNYKEQVFTCAHELGHHILHDNSNIHFLKYNTYYNTQKFENEANLFASYFIISDEEIKEINHIPTIAINYNLDYKICEKRMEYLT